MMNKLKIFLLVLLSFNVSSQELLDASGVQELLDNIKSSAVDLSTSEEYESFVKQEYSNVAKMIESFDSEIEKDLYWQQLNEKRLELASKLCIKDPRACYLIDQYHDYKDAVRTDPTEESLIHFGVDLFEGYPTRFDSSDTSSFGYDYRLKIGDKLQINIYGTLDSNSSYFINNSGTVQIQMVGEVLLAGKTLDEARNAIKAAIDSQYVGGIVSISLLEVRTMAISTVGAVNYPGTYFISSLASPLNALISSGGFTNSANLRSIDIVRGANIVANIDLYDFLISGNNLNDINLQPSDTILVNPSTKSVKILGEVLRPAIYELKESETLLDLVKFALGFSPTADTMNISIKRLTADGGLTYLKADDLNQLLKNGDVIEVGSVIGNESGFISLNGALRNRGYHPFKASLNLGNVINLERDVLDNAYTSLAFIKRFQDKTRTWKYLQVSLLDQDFLNAFTLYDKDHVYVLTKEDFNFINSKTFLSYFQNLDQSNIAINLPKSINDLDLNSLKAAEKNNMKLSSALKNCFIGLDKRKGTKFVDFIYKKLQAFSFENETNCSETFLKHPELLPLFAFYSVPVIGNLANPGLYPVSAEVNGIRLIEAAGNILDSESENSYEVGFRGSNERIQYHRSTDISRIWDQNSLIYLSVKSSSKDDNRGYITLVGEFNYPGTYQIQGNEFVSDIIKRAGGFSENAYPIGAIFTRESIKKQESIALERARIELSELLATAASSGYLKQNSTDLVGLIGLLTQVSNSQAMGRLVTDLSSDNQLLVQNGDSIYMPSLEMTVTISGQVLNPVTVPYDSSASLKDYIELAGGIKSSGDIDKSYVILPNGKSSVSSRFNFGRGPSILPGSTIIIPRQARPLDGITLVETIAPVLANLSVTAASIAAISDRN